MIFIQKVSVLFLITWASWPVLVSAETIKLKSGQEVTVSVLERTADHIKVNYQGVTLTYYNDEIESITVDTSPSPLPGPLSHPAIVANQDNQLVGRNSISDRLLREAARSVVVIYTAGNQAPALLGTGFFVSRDGLIVTNFHVIFKAETIQIKTRDGEQYRAQTVVNYDEKRDICVLKIDKTDAPALILGNSDELTFGEKVFTIGHPLGQEYRVTQGQYIGQRQVGGYENLFVLLDMQAGNSGGPLINAEGKVIGVTTSYHSAVEGYNYSLPANTVKKYLKPKSPITVRELSNSIDKSHESLYYARGAQLAGDHEQALKFFRQALETAPDLLEAWIGKGQMLTALGLNDEAFRAWQKVIERDPENAEAYRQLGKIYLDRDDLKRAAINLKKAAVLAVQTKHIYNDLGIVYSRQKMYPEAIAAYEKALEIDPYYATGYFNLAALYFNTGKIKEARKYCSLAEKYGYPIPESFLRRLEMAEKSPFLWKFLWRFFN